MQVRSPFGDTAPLEAVDDCGGRAGVEPEGVGQLGLSHRPAGRQVADSLALADGHAEVRSDSQPVVLAGKDHLPQRRHGVREGKGIVDRVNTSLEGTDGGLTGIAGTDRDFPTRALRWLSIRRRVLMILTLILLTHAFRSIVLALKAVLLNLLSLAAAFGIVVFIFQQGHGSSIWGVDASHSITAYIR